MRENVQTLQTTDISSEIFTIAPTQIEFISNQIGNFLAEQMQLRPLATKIKNIAHDSLIRALQSAKTMGK
ncbi:MAG: hypothetical protein MJ158_01665 [Alphaproteobacteria bacterium]|nr:hypothetical protein [Alphaproteobacteria bacterium]